MSTTTVPKKAILSIRVSGDQLPITGIGPGVGMAFVKAYFPKAKQSIRIASAYFTLKGYKFTRKYISEGVQIAIVVGQEQGRHVKAAVADEIMRGLDRCSYDLWEAVADLVNRMKEGRFVIRDAREMQVKFHCKFYICDDKYLFEGSANYSYTGLMLSAEQLAATEENEAITQFIEWYDPVAANAKNLMDELVQRLEKWLFGVSPFEVYLKALLLLNRIPDYPMRLGAHPPTYYQKGVIANALRQLETYDAAFIVAATGLGKTVIGAEIAMRMYKEHHVKRIILIGPTGVNREWKNQLKGRDVNYEFFDGGTLFRKPSDKEHHQVFILEEALLQADKGTLILIDEAHIFRNQLLIEHTDERESIVYSRLKAASSRGAKICLLTATVYGTNIQNLNSLLYLLPVRESSGNATGPVKDADQFAQLPVVTVLGLPHVLKMARDRGDIDENGRPFFLYGEEKRYLPKKLKLYSVRYNLFMQKEIQEAFDSNCFSQKDNVQQNFFDDSTLALQEGHVNTVYNNSLINWLSSPLAVVYGILHNLQTTGKKDNKKDAASKQHAYREVKVKWYSERSKKPVPFRLEGKGYAKEMLESFEKRRNAFAGILNRLNHLRQADDDKFMKLAGILDSRCCEAREKVIIFVSRYSTAVYLHDLLSAEYKGSLHIGCTVAKTSNGFKLKKDHERSRVLCQFSPFSQKYKPSFAYREYDVLICTDADGIGKNLQDAATVVNYDPPHGADVLFQRVGRVLRMTADPLREVSVYTLAPTVIDLDAAFSKAYGQVKKFFSRMSNRHGRSKSILGSTVMTNEPFKEISLDNEADVEQLTRDSELLSSLSRLSDKHIISHFATLEQHRAKAEKLKDYLQSALYYEDPAARLFLLLEHQQEPHFVVYNVTEDRFEDTSHLEVLNWISCNEQEQPALKQMEEVELVTNMVARKWCRARKVARREVKKVCALYLLPFNMDLTVKELVNDVQRA